MTWSEISEDLFELLVPKLTRTHFKSLHCVSRRFNALVKRQLTTFAPTHFQLFKPTHFPNVTELDFSRCWDTVNDFSLIALSKVYSRVHRSKLRRLSLAKCHGVTNKGVAAVSRHLTQLEELNLSGCRSSVPASYIGYTGVNGSGLEGLTRLKKLQLKWNPVTDDALPSITQLHQLTYLDLGECHELSENGIVMLTGLRCLEVLNLERTMMQQRGIRALAELPQLKSLSLHNCSGMDDFCVIDLTQLSQLTFLDLGKLNAITDDGVGCLIRLPRLQGLVLTYCPHLTGAWVEGSNAENEIWQLRLLKLGDCNWVTDAVIHQLTTQMLRLKHLTLKNCVRITEAGIKSVQTCALESLDVALSFGVGDRGLHHVGWIGSLQHLNLEFCAQVTDTALEAIQKLLLLRSLVLNYCRLVTYQGLRQLLSLRGTLRHLEISACHGIHPDALFFISNWFAEMEILNLSWLPIDDTQFRSLKSLKRLERIDLRGCHQISSETLKEFWYLECLTDAQSLRNSTP